jgi:hypothetical protein
MGMFWSKTKNDECIVHVIKPKPARKIVRIYYYVHILKYDVAKNNGALWDNDKKAWYHNYDENTFSINSKIHQDRLYCYDLSYCEKVDNSYETEKLKGGWYKPEDYIHSFDSFLFRVGYIPEKYMK